MKSNTINITEIVKHFFNNDHLNLLSDFNLLRKSKIKLENLCTRAEYAYLDINKNKDIHTEMSHLVILCLKKKYNRKTFIVIS